MNNKKYLFQLSLCLVLLISLAITIVGLSEQKWPQVLPWGGVSAFVRYAVFLLVVALLMTVFSRYCRVHFFALLCFFIPVISLITGNLWALMVAICFVLSSWLFGNWLLSRFNALGNGSVFLAQFLAGAGAYGTGVGLLAHIPVAYPVLYGAVLVIPLVLGRRNILTRGADLIGWFRAERQKYSRLDLIGVWIGTFAVFHFAIALLPEVSYDALALHLLVPAHLATRHQWGFDPSYYSLALIPMLGNWIFSIGYVLAGEVGARLINLCFTFLLAWQAHEIAILSGGDNKGGKWAALLILATPITLTETASLHVEAIWGAFVLGGSIALFRLFKVPNREAVIQAGLLLGFAAAAKALTLTYLPALSVFIFACGRSLKDRSLQRAFIIGALFFIIFGVIPYLTAWMISGNPVHPFFNGVFKSVFYPASNFDNPLFKSVFGFDTIYMVTFQSARYLEASNGAAGFQWLLLLPASIFYFIVVRRKEALLLFAVAILSIVVVFQSQSYLRYIFPAFVMLSALIGSGLSKSVDNEVRPISLLYSVAVISLALNILFLTAASWTYRDVPFQILLSKSDQDRYLEKRLPIRRAVELVNLINTRNAPVAFLSQPFAAGLSADALYPNWYNYKFQEHIDSVKTPQDFAQTMGKFGATILVLDAAWGTTEKRESILAATKLIAEFGSISVRELDSRYRYTRELLVNPELEGTAGWTRGTDRSPDEAKGAFIVTVETPATQSVQVPSGHSYMNQVSARCGADGAQGRVQVNWHDRDGRFISTDITVFDCTTTFTSFSQTVTSPKTAASAVVYATAHSLLPIEIDSVSFRGD